MKRVNLEGFARSTSSNRRRLRFPLDFVVFTFQALTIWTQDLDNVIRISSHVKRDLGTHHAQMSSCARKMAASAAFRRHRSKASSPLFDDSMEVPPTALV